jgi:hypothetical protein
LLAVAVFHHPSTGLLLHEVAVAVVVLTLVAEAVLVALEVVEHITPLVQPIQAVAAVAASMELLVRRVVLVW